MDIYSEPRHQHPIRGGSLKGIGSQPYGKTQYSRGDNRPDQAWHFFVPFMVDVKHAPADFLAKLREIHPRLDCIWHPVNQRWVIWLFEPETVKYPRLKGWKPVFPVQYAGGEYMPLDERTLARVEERSVRRIGSGKRYWDRIESEYWRDYDKSQANHKQYVKDCAGDMWDHFKIQVSMRGKSSGSKFSDHHA